MPTNEALAALAKQGDREALGRLWEQNRGLLMILVSRQLANPATRKRMEAAGQTFDDLLQECYFAVMAAASAYDPASGYKFTSFLPYSVANAVNRAVGLRTAKQRGDPLNGTVTSLDEAIEGDGDTYTRSEAIPDPGAIADYQNAENRIYNEQLRAALEDCLGRISPPAAAAIRGRYFDGKTGAVIAEAMGVSGSYVGQLQMDGLRQLRRQQYRLKQYHDEIITTHAYKGTGWGAWTARGSVEERILELLEHNGLLGPLQKTKGIKNEQNI